MEKIYQASDLPKYISFEEFKNKGYFIVPMPENYKSTPGLRWFYDGRDCDTPDHFNPKRNTAKGKELGTYSGKIEFVSESLKKHPPEDKERPVLAALYRVLGGLQLKVKETVPPPAYHAPPALLLSHGTRLEYELDWRDTGPPHHEGRLLTGIPSV